MKTLGDLLAIPVAEKTRKRHCYETDLLYYYNIPDEKSLQELLVDTSQHGQVIAGALRRRMAAAGVKESDLTE